MISAKRPLLEDPLDDAELELIEPPAGGVENVTLSLNETYLEGPGALKESRAPDEWKAWGNENFGSATVGEYIGQLAEEQIKLLRVALLHALAPAHGGHVTFRKRATMYAGGWGLEVIDKGGTEGSTVVPLVIVFVEPP